MFAPIPSRFQLLHRSDYLRRTQEIKCLLPGKIILAWGAVLEVWVTVWLLTLINYQSADWQMHESVGDNSEGVVCKTEWMHFVCKFFSDHLCSWSVFFLLQKEEWRCGKHGSTWLQSKTPSGFFSERLKHAKLECIEMFFLTQMVLDFFMHICAC